MNTELVMSFDTTTAAMLAEQTFGAAGLNPRVMPLPAAIRAGSRYEEVIE